MSNAVRKRDFRKITATVKGIITDTRHAFRDKDFLERIAISEGIVINESKRVRNNYSMHASREITNRIC